MPTTWEIKVLAGLTKDWLHDGFYIGDNFYKSTEKLY